MTEPSKRPRKPKRKGISKKTRFDVFKRDAFKCQYCGGHPPNIVLHVDHINPVANGGGNEEDNLITSCESCNLGKGARLLSSIPEALCDKAARVAELEEQLLGYQAILELRGARIEQELWRVVDAIDPQNEGSTKRLWASTIKDFNKRLGVHESLEAAEIAGDKFPVGDRRFRYYCGICWRKVRELEAQNGSN